MPLASYGLDAASHERFRGTVFPPLAILKDTRHPIASEQEGVKSLWVLPVMVRETVTGLLTVAFRDEISWTNTVSQYWTRVLEILGVFLALDPYVVENQLESERLAVTLDMTHSTFTLWFSRISQHDSAHESVC